MTSVLRGSHKPQFPNRKIQMEFEDMAQSKALACLPGASHHCRFVELQQFLQSRVEVISPFLNQLMLFIASLREADGSAIDIELALREALTNAVIHGNHEDPDRRVYVVFRCSTDGEVSITIRDQGQGFDGRAVPDPTAPEKLLSTHGRGIYLMRALMDEVWFEEGGAVVHMRKKSNKSGTATLHSGLASTANKDDSGSSPLNSLLTLSAG
jgi:serine/threonine-protein kinase RsbW